MESDYQTDRRDSFMGPLQPSNQKAISGGLFSFFTIEVLVLGFVLGAWIIFRRSFPEEAYGAELVWGFLGLAAAGLSGVYLLLSRQAMDSGELDYSRNLIAVAVVSGAVLLGILLLSIAREFTSSPIVIDVRDQFAKPQSASQVVKPAAAVGDASKGAQWFAQTCVTCHGPTGDGVLNAAPPLRGSPFLKTADNTTVMSLIRMGRGATDPANKTGKVMPARGGNPFLDETKIADLAAFVKQLDSQTLGKATAGSTVALNDFASLQMQLSSQPVSVVNKWAMSDFEGFQIPRGEQAVLLGKNGFLKANCNKCHMATAEGKELGPTLDQIVKKYKPDDLLSHLIEPSREINEKFQSDVFLLKDGRTITGLVVSETEKQIAMLTDLLKPEQVTTFPLSEIDERVKSKVSPMPNGLVDVLTKEEIGGLVAYVDAVGRQLGAPPAVVLNRWVVPQATEVVAPSTMAVAKPVEVLSFSITKKAVDASRYEASFSWLFLIATSVIAFHFLWLTGTGTAVVLHRELQLPQSLERSLARQTVLFWMVGLGWMVIWFGIFFLLG